MRVSKTDLNIFQNSDFITLKDLLSKFTNRAYFVGGFVRDFFMGAESNDIDIEVYDIAPAKFDKIMSELGAEGVGKSYFVYKFKNFDIALARSESKSGVGHKGFDVLVCNDECTASLRRDFTINSIMIDIFSLKILDFHGGLDDIKNQKIRLINEATFVEDSLRVYRGVQFSARFGYEIEARTFDIMRQMDVGDLSNDRIKAELEKLFRANFQGLGLKNLYKLGLFERLFGKKIDENKCKKIAEFIDRGREFIKDSRFFLYSVLNLCKIDKKEFLKKLNINDNKLINEPFFDEIDARILCEISLNFPLKEWLGLYDKRRVCLAKALNIYENRFQTSVKSEDVIRDGFKGSKIGQEILRRKLGEIDKFLKKHSFIENFVELQA